MPPHADVTFLMIKNTGSIHRQETDGARVGLRLLLLVLGTLRTLVII